VGTVFRPTRHAAGVPTTEIVTSRLADRHGVHWEARDLRGRTDRPHDMGGQNGGPMASEHLLIALASCQTTTAWKIAEKRSVDLRDVRIEAAMDFDDRGEVEGIRLRIEVESPSQEKDVAKVFELAERACTITKLLAVEPDVILVHRQPA
jgi:uncharacterized OsmC-like protein